MVILSHLLIQEGQLAVSGKRMCASIGLTLEDQAFLGKVVGKMPTIDMTILGWLGHKTSTQTNLSYLDIQEVV